MSEERRLKRIDELVHRFVADYLRCELDTDALVTVCVTNRQCARLHCWYYSFPFTNLKQF